MLDHTSRLWSVHVIIIRYCPVQKLTVDSKLDPKEQDFVEEIGPLLDVTLTLVCLKDILNECVILLDELDVTVVIGVVKDTPCTDHTI